ncbi:MAG: THUMP domain-containing protein, partial [Eubacterium aggregans]
MAKHVILVRYGEISLKGLNRNYFIDLLVKNIRDTLCYLDSVVVKKVQGRIIIDVDDGQFQDALESVQKVFGIVSISPAVVVESVLETIETAVEEEARARTFKTFRVTAKRSDKRFPMKSPVIGHHMGAVILKALDGTGISVDMTNPDMNLWVEVREETY